MIEQLPLWNSGDDLATWLEKLGPAIQELQSLAVRNVNPPLWRIDNDLGSDVFGGADVGNVFACLVWQDGGDSDGDLTHECNRTYTARTLDATAIDTGGTLLGEDLIPDKRRWVTNYYAAMNCPPATGAGVKATGYYDHTGAFCLCDANETHKAGCP